jgi:hypothetical protein
MNKGKANKIIMKKKEKRAIKQGENISKIT